jgi:hypothetical protein
LPDIISQRATYIKSGERFFGNLVADPFTGHLSAKHKLCRLPDETSIRPHNFRGRCRANASGFTKFPLSIPVNQNAIASLIAGIGCLRLVRRAGLAQDDTLEDFQGRLSR